MDVTEETSVAEGLATVADQLGPLDIVVITAGTYSEYDTLAAEPSSETRRVIETNLIGAIWCLKHVPSCMRDGGSIVCTGSIAGFGFTTFGYASYASSKAGLDYAARTLAVELGPRSIRVNTISPGGIAGTEMSPPAEFISSINLFGRPGEVDDLMGLFNLLASDASRYITGQNILVDGGISTGYSAGLTTALKASLG
jgi:NAD(P)-dependent dehydrogenase (short-subunit alcohol dehydrogenase family)